ncbi:MAG: hypothetical protein F6J95_019040 [Leptolyngbya sp. SIO1E4]|nr:hypothetical protein [Leptolyngbya sp. SIO1E4]
MTLSPLQKALVSSVCVSGALFTATTVPLAMFRSQPVEVQVQNQPVFESELNALAGPYLGVAGTFSVALGASILGMTGWRLAASKSEAEQAKSSELKRDLLAYQAELERIKFSDARLKAQDLEAFLEPHQSAGIQPAAMPIHQQAAAPVVQHNSSTVRNTVLAAEKKPLTAVPTPQGSEPQTLHNANDLKTIKQSVLELVMHQLQEPAATMANQAAADKPSAHVPSRLEKASENQLESVLHQLHTLAEQVEDLRASGSSRAAA